MSGKIYRAAVIGLGRMGAEPSKRAEGTVPNGWLPLTHIEAMLSNPRISLEWICDIDKEKCQRFSEYYKIGKYYTNYQELIDKIAPEFLSIATRTENRLDIINAALDKNVKAIYCEKPFCRNIGNGKTVLDRIVQQKVKIAYGTNRRYINLYRAAKELIHSGEVGDIIEITIEHGSAQLMWTHPHSTDLLLFLADTTDIEFIQGRCIFTNAKPLSNENIIDDDPVVEHAFFKFKNGINGIIGQSKGFNVRIACTKGTVTVSGNGFVMEVRKAAESDVNYFNIAEQIFSEPGESGTQNVFNEMLNALDEGEKMPISATEILRGMQMLFGVVQSALNNGKPIRLEDVDDNLTITGKSGIFYA